ncbi:MAG: exodeoxyribonuclease VII large subunit [Myxococcota bacterium]
MPRPPHRTLGLFAPPEPARATAALPADEGRPHAEVPQTVSQLVTAVKQTVQRDFSRVFVEGELFEVRPWSARGGTMVFFKLKDSANLLECKIAGEALHRLRFSLDEGLLVQARGRLTVFRSRVQLEVHQLAPAGQGELALAFEQRKAELEREGVFDPVHKRPLPFLPRTVGIVTSRQGAVVRDMVKILRQRMPSVSILLSPSAVQGADAAPQLIEALQRLDESGRCDVIIIGRGGGSLEDLWAFNDPMLARALRRTTTPVVAAVGHETDTTLACLAADLRAATPSHAAESVVPVARELRERLRRDERYLAQQLSERLSRARLRVRRAEGRLGDPHALLRPAERHLSAQQAALTVALSSLFRRRQVALEQLSSRLEHRSPARVLSERRRALTLCKEQLAAASPHRAVLQGQHDLVERRARLNHAVQRLVAEGRRSLGEHGARLFALSPLAVLDRGYTLVRRPEAPHAVVRTVSGLQAGDTVRLQFADGGVTATIGERVDTGDVTEEGNPWQNPTKATSRNLSSS